MRRHFLQSLIVNAAFVALPAHAASVSPETTHFESTPILYRVPSSGTEGGFNRIASAERTRHWFLLDTNGDGKLELVQMRDPKARENYTFNASGHFPHWKAWTNDGTEFTNWLQTIKIPDNGTKGSFYTLGAGKTVRQWTALPLVDRRTLELLQTADPKTGSVFKDDEGNHFWKLYHQRANDFAEPMKIRVFKSGKEKGFFSAFSGSGTDHWAMIDLTGDGRPDLVQTMDPKKNKPFSEKGTKAYWRVSVTPSDTANGFRLEQKGAWKVPDMGLEAGFYSYGMNDGHKQWITFDIDGDGKPDLVQPTDPKTGKVWGSATKNPHWRVYKNLWPQQWGFAMERTIWPVLSPFDKIASGELGKHWVTMDVDGDGKPDLVQTSQTGKNQVFSENDEQFWQVYKNTGSGFSRSASRFNVPNIGTSEGLYSIAMSDDRKQWAVMDLDGDKRLDVILLVDPKTGKLWPAKDRKTVDGQQTNDEAWRVYRGAP